jgi:FkbM family methyltransferase
MMDFYESVRDRLLRLGAAHPVLRAAISLQALANGFRVSATGGQVALARGNRRMILPETHYPQIPSAIHMWELIFATVEPDLRNGTMVLDFSKPALHRYQKTGVSLWAPGLVEEDSIDAYVAGYLPQPGDVIWDVGAHAGATSYFFAKMVGPSGRVFAFEPDDFTFDFLLRNVEMHDLNNVIPVKRALAGTSGVAPFSMDGTLGAGLIGFTQCASKVHTRKVATVSLADACCEFGPPALIKMDIEGAEADVISASAGFLRNNPIHFAIETEHRVNREHTSVPITHTLSSIGYEVWSSRYSGQQFTWARPGQTGKSGGSA